ncbi:hypothetical protein DPMN_060377 [Dreissena polymorpha]|uniref:Uncharacterized protein n=1 Tax=Dreissena polymorpha TaxID=45954 RepID=A0A9D4C5V7_DREPO|nr:hypothetical protein DPMN_060377 [Dreissena polymorpha]
MSREKRRRRWNQQRKYNNNGNENRWRNMNSRNKIRNTKRTRIAKDDLTIGLYLSSQQQG